MSDFPKPPFPREGVGIASFVLAMIGLLVFALPILGLPISAIAGLLAIAGAIVGFARDDVSGLRWSVAGLGLSLASVAINLAINFAPLDNGFQRNVPNPDRIEKRPYVAPPASLQ